jgi:hypothetical protein
VDEPTPSPDATPPSPAAGRLRDLQRLLEQMQELHAQLEYLRLMLRLKADRK